MNSKELKTKIAALLQDPSAKLAVSTGVSKNPFITVRIRPNAEALSHNRLEYSPTLPENLRKASLAVVYGADSSVAKQTTGGNVELHSIALHGFEWDQVFAILDSQAQS